MITREELRTALVDCEVVPFTLAELGDDTPIVIDSFALVWLTQVLHERHGVLLDPTDEEVAGFTSVRAIHDHLAGAGASHRGPR